MKRVERTPSSEPSELAIPAERPDFPVVGIGASAGGLEAFTQLLESLPPDTGMAFVLVQHLAPKYESMLTELLSSASELPVTEVSEGMKVSPNHVYVIPPNASMVIRDGMLHLAPRTEIRGQHMPIDMFLLSLAEDRKSSAIGVILSGTASDGANGMRAIKAEGGITLAQDPQSARYDGMPRAAIAAGATDFVLPIDGIARELAKIGHHPYVATHPTQDLDRPESGSHLDGIFGLLRSATGVDFTDYKPATIKRRIRRRMVLCKTERITDYLGLIRQNPAEVENLYQDILIHVTGFFRDPEMFEALKKNIVPRLIKRHDGQGPIRVWVPGCSTGEETYSLAIAFLEAFGEAGIVPSMQIFATDVSQPAVDRARSGFYPESIAGEVSPERLRRFFSRADGGYRISKSIRDMCVFARQDITRDPPFSKIDLISCRNLLIYLGPGLQKRIITIFHYALDQDGYLILGSSETIGSYAELFALVDKKHKIYARKLGPRRPAVDFQGGYPVENLTTRAGGRHRGRHAEWQSQIDQLILQRAPAAVVITPDMQIVHVRGEAGRFLQPAQGEATHNLLKMAREGLMLDLRTTIHAASKRNGPVRKSGLTVRQNGHLARVDIEVLPVDLVAGQQHLLVLFHEGSVEHAAPRKKGRAGAGERAGSETRESRRMRDELRGTRDYLQSIIQDQEATNEELQSANEEILSSNEELQSTNEELETAKEELQSTNEELNTVNEELQTRNMELSQVNSDLMNLLASVQIPIVMVSSDLRIRRSTPMSERLLNIIPSDIGRPIRDFKSNLKIDNLEQLIAQTIETVTVQEMEVQDLEGHWYSMRLRPYKSVDNRIDGAVVTFVDVDALKRSLAHHQDSDQMVAAMVEMVREPILILDAEFHLRAASREFYRQFRISPQESKGRSIYELDGDRWTDPRLKTLLEDMLTSRRRVEHYGITLQDSNGESRWNLNAMTIGEPTDASRLVVLGIEPAEWAEEPVSP